MKKSKLSIGLVSSFIAAMAMTACGSDVKANDNALVTFKPYDNGEEVSIVTDSMYNNYMTTTSGITSFYEQILEVLIRYDYKVSNGQEGTASHKKSLATIETDADQKVAEAKDDAKQKASDNKTSYETEWKKTLEAENVKDVKELREKYIYEAEKDAMEDWYYEENEATLLREYIGINTDGTAVDPVEGYGKLTSMIPYHVRHILVKNEEGATNFATGTIDEAKSEKLYNVVDKLINGKESFGQIAKEDSEDDSSAAKYGDLGQILQNDVSEDGSFTMIPEFQLGIYAYDALLSNKNNAAINSALGVDKTYKDGKTVAEVIQSTAFADQNSTIAGLAEVPYNVFEDLHEYRKVTANSKGQKVLNTDAESVVYPRNVLWNKYLNQHNVFVITNRNRTKIDDMTAVEANKTNVLESGYETVAEKAPGTCGFMSAKTLGITEDENMKVLTDEEDNVIFCVRGAYGIHFMVIEKSIFDFDDEVSLEQYYSTKVPSETGFPQVDGKDAVTFVNYLDEAASTYTERAQHIKDKVKAFDTTYSYRLYETLVSKYQSKLKFNEYNGQKMDELIDSYITVQREKRADTRDLGMAKAWQKYLEQIELQNQLRKNEKRIVPEGCVIGFKKAGATNSADYKEGGICYYGK